METRNSKKDYLWFVVLGKNFKFSQLNLWTALQLHFKNFFIISLNKLIQSNLNNFPFISSFIQQFAIFILFKLNCMKFKFRFSINWKLFLLKPNEKQQEKFFPNCFRIKVSLLIGNSILKKKKIDFYYLPILTKYLLQAIDFFHPGKKRKKIDKFHFVYWFLKSLFEEF